MAMTPITSCTHGFANAEPLTSIEFGFAFMLFPPKFL
jgi:hypothetical protein